MDDILDYMPELKYILSALDSRFFNNKLKSVHIRWSYNLKSNSAVSYSDKEVHTKITIALSWSTLKYRERIDLLNTILHQMIHVYCFKSGINDAAHGSNFQNIMNKINKVSGTTITRQHTFEFNNIRQKLFFWRCNGICQHHFPFRGFVVSPLSAAPGNNSVWWENHLRRCGGTFYKVKSPDLSLCASPDTKSTHTVESHWTVVDTEVMLKSPSAAAEAIIDLCDSDDEDDHHNLQAQLIKEIQCDERLNANGVSLIGYDNNVSDIKKTDETLVTFDENQSLLKNYRLDNACHLLDINIGTFDLVTCPICLEKIQRKTFPHHLNGCLGYSVQIQPYNHSLSAMGKKRQMEKRSFPDIPSSCIEQNSKSRHNLSSSTCFCPCGAEIESTDIDIHLLSCKKPRKTKTKL